MDARRAEAAIVGSGSFLPGRPVDRKRLLEGRPDLPVDLFERYFGVLARHYVIAPEDGERLSVADETGREHPLTTTEMGAQAAFAALADAGVARDEVDALITNSTTPDGALPPFALKLQKRLALKEAQLFDLRGGCSASVQALNAATMLVETGRARTALVVSSECTSPHYFAHLKNAAEPSFDEVVNGLLFADGASAVVVRRVDEHVGGLRISHTSSRSCFAAAPSGFALDVDGATVVTKHDNRAIRRTLPRAVARGFQDLHEAGYPLERFDVMVLPQVNKSMMTMVGETLGTLDLINHCYYGHETGNVPAAAMFMALDFARRRGRFDGARRIGMLSIETTSWNYAVAALTVH